MQIPLIGLLLLATPWAGSWRLITERGPEAMHLVVRDSESVELYDPVWLPHEIKGVKMEEESIEIRAVVLESIHSFTLKGTRKGEDQFTGTLTLKYPQWTSTVKFNGLRVSKKPFPSPIEWVARHREGRMINSVEFCLKAAPRGDFELFQRFWDEEFEPSFYIFLHNFLYGTDNLNSVKESALKSLFDSLEFYSQECVKTETEKALLSTEKIKQGADTKQAPPDCVVLIPGTFSKEQGFQKVASIQNKFPPGYKPCCGDSLYTLETFAIRPVTCEAAVQPTGSTKERPAFAESSESTKTPSKAEETSPDP